MSRSGRSLCSSATSLSALPEGEFAECVADVRQGLRLIVVGINMELAVARRSGTGLAPQTQMV